MVSPSIESLEVLSGHSPLLFTAQFLSRCILIFLCLTQTSVALYPSFLFCTISIGCPRSSQFFCSAVAPFCLLIYSKRGGLIEIRYLMIRSRRSATTSTFHCYIIVSHGIRTLFLFIMHIIINLTH